MVDMPLKHLKAGSMVAIRKFELQTIYQKKRIARLRYFRTRISSVHRKRTTPNPKKSLSPNGFLVLKQCRIPPRKKQVFLERFRDATIRSFPNFLSKNGHSNTCDEMHRLSVQKLLAFLNNLFAVILAKHTNMRLI